MSELGEAIRQARLDAGLPQYQLAERIGVTPATIRKWEVGVRNPRVDHLGALARELGVRVPPLLKPGNPPRIPSRPSSSGSPRSRSAIPDH